jgi:hypothetical protein
MAKNPTSIWHRIFRGRGWRHEGEIKALSKKAGISFFSVHLSALPPPGVVGHGAERQGGFEVMAISLDGGFLRASRTLRWPKRHFGQLGVQSVPSIFMAYPDENRFEPISQDFCL